MPKLRPPTTSLWLLWLLCLRTACLVVETARADRQQQQQQQQQQPQVGDEASCVATQDGTCQSLLLEEETEAAAGPEETPSQTHLLLSQKTNLDECGIWLAPSSIPGAGLGMYAGRDFAAREPLQPTGDINLPMVDINQHQFQRQHFFLLWDEYTWNGEGLLSGHEGHVEVKVGSPGFGSAANSFLDLINVEELRPDNTIPSQIHRRNDPGAGAFSTYHNRQSIATTSIGMGEELYVDYGQTWFQDRPHLGSVPLVGMKTPLPLVYFDTNRSRNGIPPWRWTFWRTSGGPLSNIPTLTKAGSWELFATPKANGSDCTKR